MQAFYTKSGRPLRRPPWAGGASAASAGTQVELDHARAVELDALDERLGRAAGQRNRQGIDAGAEAGKAVTPVGVAQATRVLGAIRDINHRLTAGWPFGSSTRPTRHDWHWLAAGKARARRGCGLDRAAAGAGKERRGRRLEQWARVGAHGERKSRNTRPRRSDIIEPVCDIIPPPGLWGKRRYAAADFKES